MSLMLRAAPRALQVRSPTVGAHSYRYSLRRGDEIVATGHLLSEHAIELGEELTVGPHRGVVVSIDPSLGALEEQLTLELRESA
jgi:hypothetical protein